MLTILGGTSRRWESKEHLRTRLADTQPVQRKDEHCSDSLIITRVTTRTEGTFFLVVESDLLLPEDMEALEWLEVELLSPWRNCIVESRHFEGPHKELALSSSYVVHVVHEECP